jgi:FixJ family two-component response regulator
MQPATDRRAQVLRRHLEGRSHAEIAAELGIDRKTVARDIAVALHPDPERLAAHRAECLDAVASLRRSLQPKAEAGNAAAARQVRQCIDIEVRLLASSADWQGATA